jgi:hypothetical protein
VRARVLVGLLTIQMLDACPPGKNLGAPQEKLGNCSYLLKGIINRIPGTTTISKNPPTETSQDSQVLTVV